ncbi:MAG: hypothetical protein AAGG75_03920 [Bacteroidota bacterium]
MNFDAFFFRCSWLLLLLFTACGSPRSLQNTSPAFSLSEKQNLELFDQLYQQTLERQSQSPLKNQRLQLDLSRDLFATRPYFKKARKPAELFYAVRRFSCARRDQHLFVKPLKEGLSMEELARHSRYDADQNHTPIRVAIDYRQPGKYFAFVSSIALNYLSSTPLKAGDRIVAVNGQPFDRYAAQLDPFLNYSTELGRWEMLAALLPGRTVFLPPAFYRKELELELENTEGLRYSVQLPYGKSQDWQWPASVPYSGFSRMRQFKSFDLYMADDEGPVLLLSWKNFGKTLRSDIDELMEWVVERERLENDLIIDATGSRGGQHGVYALQHFSSQPFRITFGDLKISTITPAFIKKKTSTTANVPLQRWLGEELPSYMEQGLAYSPAVPFKWQYLPGTDGRLALAEPHFRGQLLVILGPRGGSQLDQFAAIVKDNQLGTLIGMPAGGYSNTWEWEETITYPRTERRLFRFNWSIGNTYRPNGEVLEGNPAEMDGYLPLSSDNFQHYPQLLLERALAELNN